MSRASAVPEWVAVYQGPGDTIAAANALAVDSAGNSYITGYGMGANGIKFFVASFDPAGNLRWDYRLRGTDTSGMNEAKSIAVDRSGNVYAAGYLTNTGSGRDLAAVCLKPDGRESWRYPYNGPGNSYDAASSILPDKNGNGCFVSGYTSGIGTQLDFTVIGLDPRGNKTWIYRLNGTANKWDEVFALTQGGPAGHIYASGYTMNNNSADTNHLDLDFTVAELDSVGIARWVYPYNDPLNGWERSYDLAVDGGGNVYAAGHSEQEPDRYSFAVIKIDSSGKSLWPFFYKGTADSMDWAEKILLDGRGGVYSAGSTTGTGTGFDMSLIKLDILGKKIWVYHYDGPAHSDDEAYGLAMDESGNCYLAGFSIGVNADLTVASVDSAGHERWVYRYDGEGSGDDMGWSVKCDDRGFAYACGSVVKQDGSVAAVVVKLKTDQPQATTEKPKAALWAAIPTLIAADRVFIEGPAVIFDHTGRVVFQSKAKSKIRVPGLAAGVYFIETKEGGRSRRQKMVAVK